MPLTASQLVLRSKQLEMEAVGRMGARVELASLIGQTIHALQRERGASSLFLSSGCQRLCEERLAAMRDAVRLEAQLGESIAHQAEPESQCNASMVSLMAWVQLDLATLPALRQRIGEGTATAHEAVAAFSRLIAALLELIFHLADVAIYPGIARPLVAFVYLVQGKEAAGQERAVGAQAFASGKSTEALQQRIHHLIDAQQNSFQMLERFADPALLPAWRQWQGSTTVATLEQLRRTLLTTPAEGALDTETSETWYQVCSARIADMWAFEKQLVQGLRKACDEQVRKCQADLNDAAGLLRQLLDNPPPHTHAVERFFDADAPLGAAPTLRGMPQASDGSDATAHLASGAVSLEDLLRRQAARLAQTEAELDAARRGLAERKIIERAKRALMARMGITEEAAFRTLQKASMDNNRRLVDIAEATLSLSGLRLPPHD